MATFDASKHARAEFRQINLVAKMLNRESYRYGATYLRADPDEQMRQRIEEYKMLRTEIESIWGQAYQTLNFLLAFVGLVLSATLSKEMSKVERILMLVGISLVTLGGYSLVRVHASRVWRVTTYMRQALEPKLAGIAWESRLEFRDRVSRKRERSLFSGHTLILHTINLLISGYILFQALPAEWLQNALHNPWSPVLRYLPALVPFSVFVFGLLRLGSVLRRHGKIELKQLEAWEMKDENQRSSYDFRPGIDAMPHEKRRP